MMKITSKINITNLRRPELPMESMMVSEPRDPEVNLGNTSSTGVSSLYSNDSLLLEEEWNELFKNSRETLQVLTDIQVMRQEMEGQNNTGQQDVMACFYQTLQQRE